METKLQQIYSYQVFVKLIAPRHDASLVDFISDHLSTLSTILHVTLLAPHSGYGDKTLGIRLVDL